METSKHGKGIEIQNSFEGLEMEKKLVLRSVWYGQKTVTLCSCIEDHKLTMVFVNFDLPANIICIGLNNIDIAMNCFKLQASVSHVYISLYFIHVTLKIMVVPI